MIIDKHDLLLRDVGFTTQNNEVWKRDDGIEITLSSTANVDFTISDNQAMLDADIRTALINQIVKFRIERGYPNV